MQRSQGESERRELKLRHAFAKLREIPGLHTVEKQAIDDALSALQGLERAEERDADHERSIAEKALQSLRVVGLRLENLK